MKTFYFPIQSSSLAHYFGSAIIKPAKYFTNKPHDIQDTYNHFLLFTTKFGTTETDCCLEIVLTNDETNVLIDVKNGWFLFDEKPLPITRIKKIYFSDREKLNITITNIKMSTAYVPEMLVELHRFDVNSSASIQLPPECNGVDQEDNIVRFDKYLGALALMKTAGEPYMNYSPNYISTLSLFNSLINEQLGKCSNVAFKNSYQGLFTNSKGFEKVLPYLNKHIDEQVLNMIARDEKQEIKKDKITRVIDINSISQNTWTYTIAILNAYGVGDESRRKRIDGLIQSHFSEIKNGKAEGVALCYGYNRGYSAFTKDYGINTKVPFKYKMESQLDYYTIESVYQYIFNGKVSDIFPYLDTWCPKHIVYQPHKKTDYVILDEIIIGKKKAKVFTEEWWNGLFPKFNSEFGCLAQEIFRFFQGIINEIKTDIEDEHKELISQYESKLNENKKRIDELNKQLEQKREEIKLLQNQRNASTNIAETSTQNKNEENLKSLKVSVLKDLAKQRGLKIPNGAKKDDIIKLLNNQQPTTSGILFQPYDK